jgi:predicted amidohydrolase
MTVIPVITLLAGSQSLLDFARRLGSACLEEEAILRQALDDPVARRHADPIETWIEKSDDRLWANADRFARTAQRDGIADALADAAAIPCFDYLAVLRGLCRGPLTRYFETTEDDVVLDVGVPVPLASRKIDTFRTTPHTSSLDHGALLYPLAYWLFPHRAGGAARVVLNYRLRDRLDALTWSDASRLPRIATLHRFHDDVKPLIEEQNAKWFFGVRPPAWDLETVLAQLRRVRAAEIAVLPELCLPEAGALDDALLADPAAFPALVVAGSAHVREPQTDGRGEIRANESRVYLDGKRVAAHRKIHAFQMKGPSRTKIDEGLTKEPKTFTVLSGRFTRLAVAICADLNDRTLPGLLEQAGVNLLLVPAMTPSEGAFTGAVCKLASLNQAVGVVVNAAGHGETFHVLAAVPRPAPRQQVREYRAPSSHRRPVGIFDPNQPLGKAMSWRKPRPTP